MAPAPPAPVPGLVLDLCRRRWNVPVLARLHPGRVLAFGALAEDLGASREGLSGALGELRAPGWVEHTGGPRSPYALTAEGRRVAAPCSGLVEAAGTLGIDDVAFRRWTLPVVAALRGWELRFAELRVLLPGISPRALTLAVKDMQARGLVRRRVMGGFPPATAYRLTTTAEGLRAPVETLVSLGG